MASLFDRIYAKSPVWLQNVGISAYGFMWRNRRYGGNFLKYVAEFTAREKYTSEQWHDYQTAQLRSLLRHAARHVPYYSDLFTRLGLSDAALQQFTLADLPRLPILEKEQIRNQPEQFISRAVSKRRLNPYYTSGTTGTPLTILSTTDTDRKNQAAYETRVRRWAGLNYKMSRAMLGGRLIVPRGDALPPFWRYNIFERQLYFSAFHLAPAHLADYVQALNRFRTDYLVGYASSQFFLARMISEAGVEVYQPKAVLTSSEKLTPEMRKTISEVYQCPVFDGYSGVEACCQISECESHNLHESPDMGIIELLTETGKMAKNGETGEIIATGLLNFDQPLIRYRTGDIAIRGYNNCACGRAMPTIQELFGRKEDVVILPDGRRVASFYKVFQGISGIREAQVIQEDYEYFKILIVPDTQGFSSKQKQLLLENIHSRYGDFRIEILYMDKIERTVGGKFRTVISRIKNSQEI